MDDRVANFLAKAESRSFEDLIDAVGHIEAAIDRASDRKFYVEIPWMFIVLMALTPNIVMVGILLYLGGHNAH